MLRSGGAAAFFASRIRHWPAPSDFLVRFLHILFELFLGPCVMSLQGHCAPLAGSTREHGSVHSSWEIL